MALKTVSRSMVIRPWPSSRGAAAVLEHGDQLLVRGAVGLHPRGAERRAVDDLLHDQVHEPVAAGRERHTRVAASCSASRSSSLTAAAFTTSSSASGVTVSTYRSVSLTTPCTHTDSRLTGSRTAARRPAQRGC